MSTTLDDLEKIAANDDKEEKPTLELSVSLTERQFRFHKAMMAAGYREFTGYGSFKDLIAERAKIYRFGLQPTGNDGSDQPWKWPEEKVNELVELAKIAALESLETSGNICTLKAEDIAFLEEKARRLAINAGVIDFMEENSDPDHPKRRIGLHLIELERFLRNRSYVVSRESLESAMGRRGIQVYHEEATRLIIHEINHKDRIGAPKVMCFPNDHHLYNPFYALLRCEDGMELSGESSKLLELFDGGDTEWMVELMEMARRK